MVVTDLEEASTERVAAEVREAGGHATARVLDVSRPEELEAAVDWSEREAGPLGVLVNNAGVRDAVPDAFATTVDDWDRVFAVNVRGPFLLAQAVGRRMGERGGGSIVNIASSSGSSGTPGGPRTPRARPPSST